MFIKLSTMIGQVPNMFWLLVDPKSKQKRKFLNCGLLSVKELLDW